VIVDRRSSHPFARASTRQWIFEDADGLVAGASCTKPNAARVQVLE